MAMNYVVVLDKPMTSSDFPAEYFPRGFHYKKNANELVDEVVSKGGTAYVVPKAQFTTALVVQVRNK